MDISFIIPVLNGEQYIRRCLDSILAERLADDEVIVVDNGSTDGTVEIVRSYSGVQLEILPGLTVAALRNRGAEMASGSLLAFIDADVILCAGWREAVIEAFSEEGVHAAGSLYDLPEDAGWIEKAWFSQKIAGKRRARYINSGNLVVKSDIFKHVHGFDEMLVSDEDCEFGERFKSHGYYMLEDPAIRSIHLGNPKTLAAFYKKEKWHATSVLAKRSSALLNRPTVMSMMFGIALLLLVAGSVVAWMDGLVYLWLALPVLLIPLSTAAYRAYQFGNFRYIPELSALWVIFFLARLANMLNVGRTYLDDFVVKSK
jgi:glycosyltransferase involved in cell wall biosynthesis